MTSLRAIGDEHPIHPGIAKALLGLEMALADIPQAKRIAIAVALEMLAGEAVDVDPVRAGSYRDAAQVIRRTQ